MFIPKDNGSCTSSGDSEFVDLSVKVPIRTFLVFVSFTVTLAGLGSIALYNWRRPSDSVQSKKIVVTSTKDEKGDKETRENSTSGMSFSDSMGSLSSPKFVRTTSGYLPRSPGGNSNSGGYRIDTEGNKKSSSDFSDRGRLWTHAAQWQLPTAPRNQVSYQNVYDSMAIDFVSNLLRKFDVDPDTGFLPNKDPLQRLPYARYHLWEDLADDLPKLLGVRLGQARAPLRALPPLATDKLTSDHDLRRAHFLLCLFAHAYVWGGVEPLDRIPEGIAKPLIEVSRRLDLPPVLSHTDLVLYNWRRLDVEADICMENMCTLNNFFDGRDESWFYLITTEIEARGAKTVVPMMLAFDAIQRFNAEDNADKDDFSNEHDAVRDPEAVAIFGNNVFVGELTPRNVASYVTCELNKISEAVLGMCYSLEAMNEGCLPFIFYHRVRPFLSGWKNNPTLPNGVVYEGTDEVGEEETRHFYYGGSAAQSALIPFLDICFGIDHSKSKSQEFLLAMRNYMLKPHREFLKYCEKTACLRDYVLGMLAGHTVGMDGLVSTLSDNTDTQDVDNDNEKLFIALRDAYNSCVLGMKRFRNGHMKIVADYIIAQHKGAGATNPEKNTATKSATIPAGEEDEESGVAKNVKKTFENSAGGKGTGGTDLMTFLKPIRDHCTSSVITNESEKPPGSPVVSNQPSYLKSNSEKGDLDVYVVKST